MKALIFSMGGVESTRNADRIAAAFEHTGLDTITCDYWFGESFNPMRVWQEGRSALLSVTDFGFQSLPRLSSNQYRQAFGDDIDFIAVNAQTYANRHYPRQYVFTKDLLNTESPYYQRLRGFAARIDHLLRAISPNIAVIQQGSEVLSRLIFAKVLKAGIPWLCSETPFFPDYLLLDSAGQHFFPGKNEVDLDWDRISQTTLSREASQRTERFIAEWKKTKSSKYRQPDNSNERQRIHTFMEQGNSPLLFVPMQIPIDANVHHGLGGFESLADFYRQLVGSLPQDWRIIFKKHPIDFTDSQRLIDDSHRVLLVRDANIHELIQSSTAVAVFSSNVGLEALMYGKPVIVGGNPCYSDKGLTLDVHGSDDLPEALEKSLQWHPDTESCQQFIRYIVEDYLIAEYDTGAISKRINKAIEKVSLNITKSSAPFLEMDPERARCAIEFVHSYDKLAQQGQIHQEIMTHLTPPSFCEIEKIGDILTNDKHQVSAWLSRIKPENVTRYAFTAEVINQNCTVLDIMCGVGYGSYMLADRTGAFVDAIDNSSLTIHYAQSNWAHSNINYIAASMNSYLSENIKKEYDIVISFDTLEYILDLSLFVEQIWCRLRPGGLLLLSTPNSDVYPLIDDSLHIEHHNQQSLTTMISTLSNLAEHKIYWQDECLITDHPSHRSKFLIAAIFKNPQDKNDMASSFTGIEANIPFYYQPPNRDISSLSNFVKLLLRRKKWIKSLLFS